MKNSNLSLSLGLDVKQFHEGLDEICRHFADSRSDDYLNGLVQQVVEAKESLFGGMFMVRRSVACWRNRESSMLVFPPLRAIST